ncbi:MAG: tetratricopeptide repeat protein [Leptospiraceae bacterium]|nr:tetratricopeptide repeat protein [Leptospiraceae bacterium]
MKTLSGLEYSLQSPSEIFFISSIEDKSAFFNRLRKNAAGIIITIGNTATEETRKFINDIPILFIIQNYPHSLEVHKGNVCGFTSDVSIQYFFDVLKRIKPSAKKVYSFYMDEKGAYFAREGKYYDIWMNLDLKVIKIKHRMEVESKLKEIEKDADAFYMVFDTLYDKDTFEQVSEFCKKKGIILMTYYPGLADLGASFALAPNYTNVGIHAGEFANKVIGKELSCSSGPIISPQNPFLYLNKAYIEASGILISKEVQDREKKERLLAFAINLYNKKKYTSSRAVFENVIRLYPNDTIAYEYYNKIINLQTSNEINSMLLRAEDYRKKNDYQNAISVYKKILSLNPNLKNIQEKIDSSVFEKSEYVRKKGMQYQSRNEPYLAIKAYKEALKIYPGNQKAKEQYSILISTEKKKLKSYVGKGIEKYKHRKYTEAIVIFNNVLLVEPANKEAREYLHSSTLKQEAYERLMDCKSDLNEKCKLWKDSWEKK